MDRSRSRLEEECQQLEDHRAELLDRSQDPVPVDASSKSLLHSRDQGWRNPSCSHHMLIDLLRHDQPPKKELQESGPNWSAGYSTSATSGRPSDRLPGAG